MHIEPYDLTISVKWSNVQILCQLFIYWCKLSFKAKGIRMARKSHQDQIFDYQFKILIIGNSSVGKTSFLFRYVDDSFTSAFVSTVGIDFKVKTVFRKEKRIKLHIWVSEIQILCSSCRLLIHFLQITTWISMNYEYFFIILRSGIHVYAKEISSIRVDLNII